MRSCASTAMPGPRSVTVTTMSSPSANTATSTGSSSGVLHRVRDDVGARPLNPDGRAADLAGNRRRSHAHDAVGTCGEGVLDDAHRHAGDVGNALAVRTSRLDARRLEDVQDERLELLRLR